MRIIAGKYKGHHLVSFQASHIRPTTDRVKESLFNILMAEIPDARVLDLFSGTGNLGLEALSRGAESVVFVEKNPGSIGILKQNIQKLKLTETHKIINKDVLQFLRQYDGEPFDVIFADPPFTEQMAHDVLLAARQSKVFGSQTVLAIESARKERLDVDYSNLIQFDRREFGDKILSFFQVKKED